jgi:hypothetical protein
MLIAKVVQPIRLKCAAGVSRARSSLPPANTATGPGRSGQRDNHPSLRWFFNKVKRLLKSLKRRSQTARLNSGCDFHAAEQTPAASIDPSALLSNH